MKNFIFLLIFFSLPLCALALSGESAYLSSVTPVLSEEVFSPSPSIDEPKDSRFEFATDKIRLKKENGTIETVSLEKYIEGVVAGEMSASAPLEALKAMAVAARTYTLSVVLQNLDKDADITTDPSKHQAYRETEGKAYENIKKAVEETKGEVLTFDGDVILALYHASSADATENCESVFVEERPYLKSVSTPHETKETAYRSVKTFTLDELNKKLKNNGYPAFEKDIYFKIIKGESGRCKTLVISDARTSVFIDGRRVREIFSLKSSSFDVSVSDIITFNVYGYGHGVGMSQNGAEILAKNGKTYREILETYYLFSDISNIVYKS